MGSRVRSHRQLAGEYGETNDNTGQDGTSEPKPELQAPQVGCESLAGGEREIIAEGSCRFGLTSLRERIPLGR
jgi:hypothetical protein